MKTVMLIDDSEADLLYSQLIVARSGVCETVVEFGSASAALDHLRAGPEDVELILLDINMPGMDGFQFLEAYDRLEPTHRARVPVVMLTSSPDPRDRERAEGYGCVHGYVVKPLSVAAARTLEDLRRAPAGARE